MKNISVCIYCGEYKIIALQACEGCLRTPESHSDIIHSIILAYSEERAYLNFLTRDKIQAMQEDIVNGLPIKIEADTFSEAEEAYSAVKTIDSPHAIGFFSKMTAPVIMTILFLALVGLVIGG